MPACPFFVRGCFPRRTRDAHRFLLFLRTDTFGMDVAIGNSGQFGEILKTYHLA